MKMEDLEIYCSSEQERKSVADMMAANQAFPECKTQNFINELVPLFAFAQKEIADRSLEKVIDVEKIEAKIERLEDIMPVGIRATFVLCNRAVGRSLQIHHVQENPIGENDFLEANPGARQKIFAGVKETVLQEPGSEEQWQTRQSIDQVKSSIIRFLETCSR